MSDTPPTTEWCPPALLLPELGPSEPVEISAAPAAPEIERGWLSVLLPGLSALGMLGFALLSPNVLIVAIMGGVAVVSTVGVVWSGRISRLRHERQWAERCERYRRHLERCDQTLMESTHRQRAHANAAHPAPSGAARAVEQGRLWEANCTDTGLRLRLGTGRASARRPPRLSTQAADAEGDLHLQRAALVIAGRHSAVDAIPVHLELFPGTIVAITGDQLPALRAFVVSLTRAYRPEVLRLHILASPAEASWLRLLPHTASVAENLEQLRAALRSHLADDGPYQLVIAATGARLDLESLSPMLISEQTQASLMALLPASQTLPTQAAIVIDRTEEGGLLITRPGQDSERQSVTRPDALSFPKAQSFARAMARHAPSAQPRAAGAALRLTTLLRPAVAHPLMIPIGCDEDGERVLIDLREAARGGHGPHGLVIGCTGSGKSELLRTLLVAAAHQSTPDDLALLLIDYKGGAAFAELARLPHVAGLLTNLSSDPSSIDRMCASLRAELRRRQQLLRSAGAADLDSYRASTLSKTPLPRLLVVVDEYAELIEESPEALDVLTSLGRLGRSLGIHLLLSSQRLDDGRLRGLDAHLRLRVCLRTLNASDSIAVIGSALASQLPAAPGIAILSRDGALTRLRVALADEPALNAADGPSKARVTSVCLPPLPDVLNLDALRKGFGSVEAATAAVGLIDLPELGEQRPLVLDLASADAHLAIAGAPRSGRSTALTSVVAAAALTTSPRDLAVHVITAAGSPLAGLAGLPHVGTVATSPELARRVVLAVVDIVSQRQQAGSPTGPRVLLVIDDLASNLTSDDASAVALSRIANIGLSVGVSLAISCTRWLELRGGLREAFGSRWELRLNDPGDSQLPALARRVTNRPAGRILTATGLWAQLALPGQGDDPAVSPEAALSHLVADVARRGGPATRPVQLLPALVPAQSLPPSPDPERMVIGVRGPYADAAQVSLGPGEHFLVLGNSRTGRSGLLRAIVVTAIGHGSKIWLLDPRRSLTLVAERSHRHACTAEEIADLVTELGEACRSSAAASRSGGLPPRHLLVIDDLELAEGRDGGLTLAPLAQLLAFAAESGLTVVATRRLSGSGRATFNPFYGRFLEFCESGIILSGDPAEGPAFGGRRPQRRPPGRGDLIVRGESIGELQIGWLGPESIQLGNRAIPVKSSGNPRGWV